MRSQASDPDVMLNHRAAISCRVAPSFLRVGHLDLFARRVRATREQQDKDAKHHVNSSQSGPQSAYDKALNELTLLMNHAIYREYPHISGQAQAEGEGSESVSRRGLEFLKAARENLAILACQWQRVGFVCVFSFSRSFSRSL